jgi:hypothetical protein
MLERGQLFADEIAAGACCIRPRRSPACCRPRNVERCWPGARRPSARAAQPPRFQVGQRVRTRAGAVPHHTRLPGYVRGKCGTIETAARQPCVRRCARARLGRTAEPLYTVVFDGAELWGGEAQPGLRVSVDAWQSYLEAA